MIVAGQRLPIVIATKPVDFRLGHDGLAATVQNELGLDPHSGMTVVFRSKRGDRLKVLVWDGTGLVLIYKRLEVSNFVWPKIQDGVMQLSLTTSRTRQPNACHICTPTISMGCRQRIHPFPLFSCFL